MSDDTSAKWRKRVARWRASGETAAEFSAGQGFAASTLRWWSSRLGREAGGRAATAMVRIAQLVRVPDAVTARPSAVVIELLDASARITVETGVDRETLAAVLAAIDARSPR